MVLGASRSLIRGGHVAQVATVLVPTVVEGLALKECWGRGQVGDGLHRQVMVRGSVLRRVGMVLGRVVMRVMVRGRRLEVGKRMSHGATGRKSPSGGVEAQRGGGGGGRGGCRWDQAGARPRGARGVGSKVERQWETAGLEGHRAGHPEALLFVGL